MTPYYADEQATLYHGDCLNVHEWLRAHVLVTDPPYGIGYRSNARRTEGHPRSIAGDLDTTARDDALSAWDEAGGGPALLFGTWRIPRPAGTRQVLIWDTKGALGMGAMDLPWKPSHQEVYVIGRGFTGRRDTDVLTCAPVQAMASLGRTHPHEKPVALMGALIRKTTGTVADPFVGSGTTLVAAKAEGRRAIGVEVDERYCEIAAQRLTQDALDFGSAS